MPRGREGWTNALLLWCLLERVWLSIKKNYVLKKKPWLNGRREEERRMYVVVTVARSREEERLEGSCWGRFIYGTSDRLILEGPGGRWSLTARAWLGGPWGARKACCVLRAACCVLRAACACLVLALSQ